jgi:hypothetical protein
VLEAFILIQAIDEEKELRLNIAEPFYETDKRQFKLCVPSRHHLAQSSKL